MAYPFVVRHWNWLTHLFLPKSRDRARTAGSARRDPGGLQPTSQAPRRGRWIPALACAVVVFGVAASCGGDDESADSDGPESAETAALEDEPTTGDDESADSDGPESAETAALEDEPTTAEDEPTTTTSAAESTTDYESEVVGRAYSAAREAFSEYSLTRNDAYLLALDNVVPATNDTAATRAAARSAASEAFAAAESQTAQVLTDTLNELRFRFNAASAETDGLRSEVERVLTRAGQEAELDSSDAYQVWDSIGSTRTYETRGTSYTAEEIGRIAGKIASRQAFNEIYLSVLETAITDGTKAPAVVQAIAAARDAAQALVTANPLLFENPDRAIDEAIAAVVPVSGSSRREVIVDNIETRVDTVIAYDILAPALTAASATISEIGSARLAALEATVADEEQAASDVSNQAMAKATADRDAAFQTADQAYEAALDAVAAALSNARSAFEFDDWVSASFALGDAYVVLHDVAAAAESEAQISDDGSLAASAAVEYSRTLRSELVAIADAANFLSNSYTRRTAVDAEAEFAQAAEALFLEAELFEDALSAARSRAEARSKAISG